MRNLVPTAVLEACALGRMQGSLPGSVLLLDAEGSTRLSEELSAFATAGAESLADVLTAVFTPIVTNVHRYGGFVAQFTGDGVLAVFPGEPTVSARAAASAGMAVRSTLLSLPQAEAQVGSPRLTVRAVVATGSVTWSIWGSADSGLAQRHAFVYLGSALDEAQRGEPLVAGGQLALARSSLAQLGGDARFESLDDDFALLTSLDHPATPTRNVEAQVAAGLAREFNPSSVLRFAGRGEFRDVVSVFVAIRHVPPPGDDDDIFPKLLALLGSHGGYLCDVTRPRLDEEGVTVFAFWGAPKAHEHDVEHAARWVLALQDTLGHDEIKAGITAETVFAGFVGSALQEAYTCVGAGVNLAARMCATAEWGELRIGSQVPPSLPDDLRHSPLGAVAYRGFAEPITTHRLVPGEDVPPAGFIDPLIGRSAELAALESTFAAATAARSARIVHIYGEAGSGKSHLLDTLHTSATARTPPPLWLRTRADEVRRDPFGPIRVALRTYFGRGDGDLATAARLDVGIRGLARRNPDLAIELDLSRRTLGELVAAAAHDETDIDARIRFERTVMAIEALLRAEGRSRPVVLDVRDAQWLDPSAVSLLDRLRRDLADQPIVLLVETREPLSTVTDATIELAGLEEADVRRLAESLLGTSASTDLVHLLMERTSGNPFFVRQVVRFLQEQDLLRPGDDGLSMRREDAAVPSDLRPVLIARLDRLSQSVRRTVLTAAVLGREFQLDVLSSMLAGQEDVAAAVAQATADNIWSPSGGRSYLFRHAMLRDAAYDMQLNASLRRLHEHAADAIAALRGPNLEPHAAQLAFHLDRAQLPERALPFYVSAGHEAARRFANDQAVADLERALAIMSEIGNGDRYPIVAKLIEVHDVRADRAAQGGAIDALQGLAAADPGRQLDVARRKASWHIALGEYDRATEVVDDAIARSGDGEDGAGVARLMMIRARITRYLGDSGAAMQSAAEAERLFVLNADDRGVAAAQDLRGGLAWEQGEYEAAVTQHREAAHLSAIAGDKVGEIGALNNLGTALFSLGDYAAARTIHGAGIRRSREIGYRMAESDHLDNRGGTAWAVGAYEEARADYSAALAIRRRMQDAWGVAISQSNLGATHRALGELDVAEGHYEEALAVDRMIGRKRGEAYDLHGLGLVHRDAGDLAAADAALSAAIAIRHELGEDHLANESLVARADVLRRSGELEAATALVDAAMAAEGAGRFGGAVETTAALLHCYRVLEEVAPDRARELLDTMAASLDERASRISDESQRRSYLENVASHAAVITAAAAL